MNETISIIIPVYNVEKYLNKCLNSVIEQTYKNIEVILIDDGSTDNSGKICDEYAKNDIRIKIIHQQNGGVSTARNNGLEHATGKYITFVDSDDYIEKEMIETMAKKIMKKNADIVICGVTDRDEENNIINQSLNKKENVFNNIEAIKEMLDEKLFNCVCWAKLYKKELFRNIKFNSKIRIAEDMDVLYRVFYKSNKIIQIPERLYNWTSRGDSVTKGNDMSKWQDEIDVCENIIKFCEENCNEIEDYAVKRYIRINLTLAVKNLKEKGSNENFEYLRINLIKYNVRSNKVIDKKMKIRIYAIEKIHIIIKLAYKIKNRGE